MESGILERQLRFFSEFKRRVVIVSIWILIVVEFFDRRSQPNFASAWGQCLHIGYFIVVEILFWINKKFTLQLLLDTILRAEFLIRLGKILTALVQAMLSVFLNLAPDFGRVPNITLSRIKPIIKIFWFLDQVRLPWVNKIQKIPSSPESGCIIFSSPTITKPKILQLVFYLHLILSLVTLNKIFLRRKEIFGRLYRWKKLVRFQVFKIFGAVRTGDKSLPALVYKTKVKCNYIRTQCKSDILNARIQGFLVYATLGQTLSCRLDRCSLLEYFWRGFWEVYRVDQEIEVYGIGGFAVWQKWGWCARGLNFCGKLIWIGFWI